MFQQNRQVLHSGPECLQEIGAEQRAGAVLRVDQGALQKIEAALRDPATEVHLFFDGVAAYL